MEGQKDCKPRIRWIVIEVDIGVSLQTMQLGYFQKMNTEMMRGGRSGSGMKR